MNQSKELKSKRKDSFLITKEKNQPKILFFQTKKKQSSKNRNKTSVSETKEEDSPSTSVRGGREGGGPRGVIERSESSFSLKSRREGRGGGGPPGEIPSSSTSRRGIVGRDGLLSS